MKSKNVKKKKDNKKNLPTRVEKYEYLNKRKELEDERVKEERRKKKEKRRRHFKKVGITVLSILFILILLLLIYARFIEPNMLIVKEYKLQTEKIDEESNGLKIAHFSDLHYGSTIDKNNISSILEKFININADIILFTGDLIEESFNMDEDDRTSLVTALKNMPAKYGKYAVNGNHDLDSQGYDSILKEAGFKLLKNELEIIYTSNKNKILIYGLENMTKKDPSFSSLDKVKDKYNDSYKILLIHEPDYYDELKKDNYQDYFDLILSGHSHGGQVTIPVIQDLILPPNGKKYYKEKYNFGNTTLFVSSGIGCSSFNYRFGVFPSINFYRIRKR